ncbi:MAG: hypothetical protein PWQ67_574 [Clostridia bacterium]|nr:hypothetical protein [Clostridia bacterium]MDN5322120.1 hypothetical protein [Clostridia bacterium]
MRNMIALLFLLFIGIILLEVPGLVKKKMWRELVSFSIYLFIGMALSIPQVLGVKIPNPTKVIEVIFRPISELLK